MCESLPISVIVNSNNCIPHYVYVWATVYLYMRVCVYFYICILVKLYLNKCVYVRSLTIGGFESVSNSVFVYSCIRRLVYVYICIFISFCI